MPRDYLVVFRRNDDGSFTATVPELSGAISEGPTLDEAKDNIRDAIQLVLETYHDNARQAAADGATVEAINC